MKDCIDCLIEGETCDDCLAKLECLICGVVYADVLDAICPACLKDSQQEGAEELALLIVPPDPPRERKEGDCVRCFDEPAKYDYPVADRTIRVGGKCWYALTGRAYREPEFQEAMRD